MPVAPKIDLRQARAALTRATKGLHIHYPTANKIVKQEIVKTRKTMINTVSHFTTLSRPQVRKRVYVSRGRNWNRPKRKWKFAQVKTRGKAKVIHAGRLRPKRASRARGAGINVAGQNLPTGFFWNPPGRTLLRDERRLYRRTVFGIKAVRARDLGITPITTIYRTAGKRIELALIRQVSRRILKEAIPSARGR